MKIVKSFLLLLALQFCMPLAVLAGGGDEHGHGEAEEHEEARTGPHGGHVHPHRQIGRAHV